MKGLRLHSRTGLASGAAGAIGLSDNRQMKLRALLPSLLAPALFAVGCASSGGGSDTPKALNRQTMGPAVKSIGLLDARSPVGATQRSFTSGVSASAAARLSQELFRRSQAKGDVVFVDARGLGLKPADLAAKTEAMTSGLNGVGADAWGAIRLLGCGTNERSQQVTRGSGAAAVTVTEYWWEGSCSAELTVVDPGGKAITTFEVEGRNESPRNERREGQSVQEQVYWASVDDAAKRLIDGANRKKLRQPVPFDTTAPLATEGLAEIDAGRLPAARTLWEGALAANPSAAGLRFNLGAVCEALGDAAAARASYEEALRLAPADLNSKKALARLGAAAAAPAKK